MYLQGNLQSVFDALYHLGVIDPILEKDWAKMIEEMPDYCGSYEEAVHVANIFQDDIETLMVELDKFDQETLGFLAMEVAKEFADFHSRENTH